MRPGALGGTQDRAQIVGVGDLVTHHQQRRFALLCGGGQNAVHRHVFPHGGQGDHALVCVGAAHVVQLPPVSLHHHDPGGAGLGGDVPQRLVRLALGEVNFVDGRFRPQRLNDGVAPFDNAIGLRLRQRPAALGVLHTHTMTSFMQS